MEPEENNDKLTSSPLENQDYRLVPVRILISEQFSFTETVRKPLKTYMNLTGLHEGHSGRFLNCYRRVVVFFLFVVAIRRATQIRAPTSAKKTLADAIFDPNVVLSLVIFLFTLSAFISAVMSERLYAAKKKYLESIDLAMRMECPNDAIKRGSRKTKHLIFINILLSSIAGFMDSIYKFGLLSHGVPPTPPLFVKSAYLFPVESFLTALCQAAINFMATDFFLSCTFLRFLIANVSQQMAKNFRGTPTLVKLQHLDEIQTHHHYLLSAKKNLEDCYSFTIFCFYSFSIPCCCFLSYVAYRNAGTNPGIIFAMGLWISVTILNLLILSIPAFQLTEEGQHLGSEVFDLYQSCLRGEAEDDSRILAQMLILVSQIQANPISISAYNYFPINRGILLTMFSAIFTYFLILVQFGDEQEPKDKSTELIEKAIEMCSNFTLFIK